MNYKLWLLLNYELWLLQFSGKDKYKSTLVWDYLFQISSKSEINVSK